MRWLLAAVVVACVGSHIVREASAQDAPAKKTAKAVKTPPHVVEFQRLDRDRDGKLNADEFLGGSIGKAGDEKRRQHAKFDEDQDGTLSTAEFWKYQNRPASEDWLRNDFKQRDKDKNGTLNLKEYLGDKSGALRTEAHSWFFRYDTDENEEVTLEEFLDRDSDRQISIHNQFRVHDLDIDGLLTEQEFMRTRIGKSYEKVSRENFAKFDTNGDRKLSESEFTSLPGMVTQQAAIERETRARNWAQFAAGLTLVVAVLLLTAIIGWFYWRHTARQRKSAAPAA